MTGVDAQGENDSGAATLPATPLCREVIRLVVSVESPPIAHHSIRSFLFARLFNETYDRADEVDPELLFAACVMHDLGLSAGGDRNNRFEIDGADVAAEFLSGYGMTSASVAAVWDAIALHGSAGLAARRSPLCAVTQAGVWADFGGATPFVSDAQAAVIHEAYPRLRLASALADAIVDQADGRPEKAPRYSLADALIQERSAHGTTRMEMDEAHSRWAPWSGH